MNSDGTAGAMDIVSSILTGIVDWLRMPIDSKGTALNWFLVTGMFVVFAGLWNFILIDMTRE